ncbi:MAG: TVP38/TMEM64 family protein [Planctomycetota bacterium]|nr:MAG: TVP38/TMEM64 family protein [Planctomycetota bacterium]
MTEHDHQDPPAPKDDAPATPAQEEQSLGEVFRKLGPAGYLAIAWTTVPIVGSILLWMKMGTIGDWLRGHEHLGVGIYILVFVFSAGFGVLPTYVQAILAGWAFGVAVGTPAAIVGVTGAAMVGFVAARVASRDRAERLIAENVKARAIKDALIGHGFWKSLGIVTLLRLPINSPFALTNLVMASAGVTKRVFLIGTAVGMAPRTGAGGLSGRGRAGVEQGRGGRRQAQVGDGRGDRIGGCGVRLHRVDRQPCGAEGDGGRGAGVSCHPSEPRA